MGSRTAGQSAAGRGFARQYGWRQGGHFHDPVDSAGGLSGEAGVAAINTAQTGYILRLLYIALGMLFAVHLFGTVGYMVLTDGKYSWFDCFYMTFITVATIGFGEIIDMSSNQPARVLTVIIGIFGAGTL